MDNNDSLQTWENEVVVEKRAGVRLLFETLAKDNSCSFEIIKDRSTFMVDQFSFKFQGKQINIDTLLSELEIAIVKWHIPHEIKYHNYQISSLIEKEHTDKSLAYEIQSPKYSKVKELVEILSDELDINFRVSEKSNGFLKGKTVNFSTNGERDKMEKFKKIFHHILQRSEEIYNPKPKMRM